MAETVSPWLPRCRCLIVPSSRGQWPQPNGKQGIRDRGLGIGTLDSALIRCRALTYEHTITYAQRRKPRLKAPILGLLLDENAAKVSYPPSQAATRIGSGTHPNAVSSDFTSPRPRVETGPRVAGSGSRKSSRRGPPIGVKFEAPLADLVLLAAVEQPGVALRGFGPSGFSCPIAIGAHWPTARMEIICQGRRLVVNC